MRRAGVGSAVAALTLAAAPSQGAEASEITVTNTRAKGDGSFLAAFHRANGDDDRDEIVFSKALRGTINLRDDIRLKEPVVVTGRGYGKRGSKGFGRVVIQGPRRGVALRVAGFEPKVGNTLRELYLKRVSVFASDVETTIRDSYLDGMSTVTGNAGVDAEFVYGYNDERLRIEGSTVTGYGSGVSLYKSYARIDESRISGNLGSGVYASSYSGFGISNSTISGNEGVGAGAGYESGGSVTNSTISENVSEYNGGGVYGDVSINESTITDNWAVQGGGVYGSQYYGDAHVTNSIIAGNQSTEPGAADDCGSNVKSFGGNLFGSAGDCELLGSDLDGADPRLGPLAANGGPTRTYALGKGSPAIGLAVEKEATKFDQRHVRRDDDPDSGAYERRGKR